MERNEIIFFAAIIILYAVCAFTLDIPTFVNYIFIAVLIIVLLVSILLKYQHKFNNRKIYDISRALSLIFLASYVICAIYEMCCQKTLPIDSSLLLIPFFGAIVISWFLKNS